MMMSLTLARDSHGCLQTNRRARFRHGRLSLGLRSGIASQLQESPPEIRNDGGAREIRVRTRSLVCTGQAPPNDHPHVSLRIGKDDRAVCPYCSTEFVFKTINLPRSLHPKGGSGEIGPALSNRKWVQQNDR